MIDKIKQIQKSKSLKLPPWDEQTKEQLIGW